MAFTRAGTPIARRAVQATLFAAWCVFWPWWLLERTRGLPGAFTGTGDRGAFEVIEWFTARPAGETLALLFAALLALCWLLLQALARLDRDGHARAAWRWALSSRSLCLCLSLVPPLSWWALSRLPTHAGREAALAAVTAAMAVALLAMPFFALNPATLARARLRRWWAPMWPGVLALVVCPLLVLALPEATGVLLDDLSAGMPVWYARALALPLALVVQACVILSTAVWLARGRGDLLRTSARRLCTWPFLRAYAGLQLIGCLALWSIAVPPLAFMAYDVFLAPQYADIARTTGHALPARIDPRPWPGEIRDALLLWITVTFATLNLLSLGRLFARFGAASVVPVAEVGPTAGDAGMGVDAIPS